MINHGRGNQKWAHNNQNKNEENPRAIQELIMLKYGWGNQKCTQKNKSMEEVRSLARQEKFIVNNGRENQNETKNANKTRVDRREKNARKEERGSAEWECVSVWVRVMCIDLATESPPERVDLRHCGGPWHRSDDSYHLIT